MSKAIITALAQALPKLESAKKNAANPHLKSKYANLSAVMAAVEPVREHGLWYRQRSHDNPEGAAIETIYLHESGEEMSAGITFVRADKPTAQGYGSAMTYARRYSLQTAFGLDAEDDDGHSASYKPKEEKKAPPKGKLTPTTREWLEAQVGPHRLSAFLKHFNTPSLKDVHYEHLPEMQEWIKEQNNA